MRYLKKILDRSSGCAESLPWITEELVGSGRTPDCAPVWFDIETTGLSPKKQEIYLIGAVCAEGGSLTLRQWFSDGGPEEESGILTGFLDWIPENAALISFNGERFDLPFIHNRCQVYGLEDRTVDHFSLDLYRSLRKYKKLLDLSGTKQVHFEQRLGSDKRDAADGRTCIRLYRQYAKAMHRPDNGRLSGMSSENDETEKQLLKGLREAVLLHNEEDLSGLIRIGSLLSCRQLTEGRIRLREAHAQTAGLTCLFETEKPLPTDIEFSEPGLYLQILGDQGKAILETWRGNCRLYHEDYKNYEYLPGEDMAVHRSLSAYIDRSLKEPATRGTCYTPVPCTQELAHDLDRCAVLLRSGLIFHLGT